MRIEPRAFALAAGTAAALLFTLCVPAVFLAGELLAGMVCWAVGTAATRQITWRATRKLQVRRRATASIGLSPRPKRAMVSRFCSSSP
jgi:type IV secretory pathway TrbD component